MTHEEKKILDPNYIGMIAALAREMYVQGVSFHRVSFHEETINIDCIPPKHVFKLADDFLKYQDEFLKKHEKAVLILPKESELT